MATSGGSPRIEACPHCRQALEVDPQDTGMVLECPLCQGHFQLQPDNPPPDSPPRPPPKAERATTERFKNCPFCSEQILATAIKCKHCGSSLLAAVPGYPQPPRKAEDQIAQNVNIALDFGSYPQLPVKATEQYSPPGGIVVPLLISAIGNILASLFWISLIVTFFLAIPLVILCVFEFILYAQASRLSPRELANKARSIAIAEIVLGLFLSLPAFVCGIIILVNSGKQRTRIMVAPRRIASSANEPDWHEMFPETEGVNGQ
jgi:hypothetical protein